MGVKVSAGLNILVLFLVDVSQGVEPLCVKVSVGLEILVYVLVAVSQPVKPRPPNSSTFAHVCCCNTPVVCFFCIMVNNMLCCTCAEGVSPDKAVSRCKAVRVAFTRRGIALWTWMRKVGFPNKAATFLWHTTYAWYDRGIPFFGENTFFACRDCLTQNRRK